MYLNFLTERVIFSSVIEFLAEAVELAEAVKSDESVEAVYRVLCIVYRWFSV